MALKDLLLVYARNIGKGFKKNYQTKQFDVALGKSLKFNENGDIDINTKAGNGVVVNDDGSLGFELSPDSGNLLEQRKNGLYYGVQAAPNLVNLYVDAVNGVDQNPEEVSGAGTQAKPLRTLKYALDLAKEGTTRRVYLKEEQTHNVSIEQRIWFKTGSVSIRPYGPKYQAKVAETDNGFISDGWILEQGYAPVIKFSGVHHRHYSSASHNLYDYLIMYIYANTTVNFGGIAFENDINSTLESSGESSNLVARFGRIFNEGGSLHLVNFGYRSNGAIRGVGQHKYITEGFKTNGIYNTGLIHQISGIVEMRNLKESPVSNMVDHLFAHHGWDPYYMGSIVSLSLLNSGFTKEHYQRILGVRISSQPSGDKYILAPQIDVETANFV